jgi:hypothetical protein
MNSLNNFLNESDETKNKNEMFWNEVTEIKAMSQDDRNCL